MDFRQHRLLTIGVRSSVGVGAVVLAVLIYVSLVQTSPRLEPIRRSGLHPEVVVFEAQQTPVRRQWRSYGTVEAMESADIPARLTASIGRRADQVLSGMAVHRGQLLIQLDDSDFQRKVEIARYAAIELEKNLDLIGIEHKRLTQRLALEVEHVRLLRDELTRLEQLLEQGAANPRGVDAERRLWNRAEKHRLETAEALEKLGPRRAQIEAQLESQRSSLRLAQQDLDRCRITSPIDGILQEVDVEVGEQVGSGHRVARVVNLDQIEVVLQLPAAARPDVSVQDKVILHATNRSSQSWEARVSRISPVDDLSTRTVTVYVEVDQPDALDQFVRPGGSKLLIPGMFVTGLVTSDREMDRWIVPQRSIRSGRIQVVEQAKVVSRPVKVEFVLEGRQPQFGIEDDQWAVLATNPVALKKGAIVMLNYLTTMTDGQEVKPMLADGNDFESDVEHPHREGQK